MVKSGVAKAVDKKFREVSRERTTKKKGLVEGVDSDYQWNRLKTKWAAKQEGWV